MISSILLEIIRKFWGILESNSFYLPAATFVEPLINLMFVNELEED